MVFSANGDDVRTALQTMKKARVYDSSWTGRTGCAA
jgi:hypothetical protein